MKADIAQFLRTGDADPLMANWPGAHTLDRIQRGEEALTDALLVEVRRREAQVSIPTPAVVPGGDLLAFSRVKLGPMVRGLFPRAEQEQVLKLLERSVEFLTPESIERLIRKASFLHTAWKLANIYLVGIGAEPLGNDMRRIVGMRHRWRSPRAESSRMSNPAMIVLPDPGSSANRNRSGCRWSISA
jgi:hypothetical protein